jgi:hypothetical protein
LRPRRIVVEPLAPFIDRGQIVGLEANLYLRALARRRRPAFFLWYHGLTFHEILGTMVIGLEQGCRLARSPNLQRDRTAPMAETNNNTNAPTLDLSLLFNASIGFAVLRETLDGIMTARSEEARTNLAHQAIWAADVIDRDLKAALKNVEAVATIEQ